MSRWRRRFSCALQSLASGDSEAPRSQRGTAGAEHASAFVRGPMLAAGRRAVQLRRRLGLEAPLVHASRVFVVRRFRRAEKRQRLNLVLCARVCAHCSAYCSA